MKKAKSFPLLAAVAAATALAATVSAAPAGAKSTQATAGTSCTSTLKLALVTPLTGGAGFLGQQQSSWAKYAVKTLAPGLGLKVKLVLGDTPVEQGAAVAQTLAQKYVADKSVVGVIGPSTSGAVAAASKTLTQAGILHISESATRTTLTKGDNQEAGNAFYRVVPADDIQGPTDANYMMKTLKVKNVVVIDFQEPYSQGLAGAVETALKAGGVSVTHLSISNTTTDFSTFVTKVPGAADIVFFPTQKPGDAQAFAQQLAEQGKKAKVFGGDGSNDSTAFKAAGSYVSNFAPDISGIASDKAIIAGWQKDNKGKTLGSFGPPTYGAVQVMLKAVKAACVKGHGSIAKRGAVVQAVKGVTVPTGWILGGAFKWSKVNLHDPANAKFYIFQIQSDGTYKLVG
ncbi:MAG TPA: branched-chain amino acid ABC transporter substrate-binding protein [Gaiellales bacterium]|jgi:branched-chain amino acid transport system substrate-binding protein|nr:branched-chain amino acid ABC transporter substrate-binding protein [Gaiellales bacterium]